jgi:Pilus formation protein N terminal region
MMKSGIWSVLACAATVTLLGGQAFAAQQITLKSDTTELLALNAEPGTVVIGNPSIADITVNGKQIFLHGHSFGDTNLIILDLAGNKIADYDITVGNESPHMLVVFKGGKDDEDGYGHGRFSYTCAPYCETVMAPGDVWKWTKKLININQDKAEFATGKRSTEAAAPAAPQ